MYEGPVISEEAEWRKCKIHEAIEGKCNEMQRNKVPASYIGNITCIFTNIEWQKNIKRSKLFRNYETFRVINVMKSNVKILSEKRSFFRFFLRLLPAFLIIKYVYLIRSQLVNSVFTHGGYWLVWSHQVHNNAKIWNHNSRSLQWALAGNILG